MKEKEQGDFIKQERIIFQRIFKRAGLESIERQVKFVEKEGKRVRDYTKKKYGIR